VRKLIAVLGYVDALNDWVGKVLSFGVLLMFFLVLSEVIRRYFFNAPTVFSRLSTRARAIVDICTFVLFLLFCGMMLVYGGSLAWESLSIWERSNSAWGVPLYPAKMMIPIGAFLLLLQGFAKLIRDILTLLTDTQLAPGDAGERETL
jgi:TRAP-type mannitol/chloroaromatic compound transport system permease small subunit